jgi:DnaA family protein
MTQQLILDVLPAPPPSLENFVTGKNRAAMDALAHIEPGRAIYLWGVPGVGRTHLLTALGNAPNALYVGSSEQARELLDIATSDVMSLKLIAIDNVDHLSEAAQAAVFALYNRWREVSATTQAFSLVLAGDQAP